MIKYILLITIILVACNQQPSSKNNNQESLLTSKNIAGQRAKSDTFGHGAIPDKLEKIQKTHLLMSKNFHDRGKDHIKSKDASITDLQIATATIAGAGIYPATFKLFVPPVGNQGAEGACVAFAADYYGRSINYYYANQYSTYSTSTNVFSPEYVYDQTKINCFDGSSLLTNLDFLINNGDVLLATVPYSSSNGCEITPTADQVNEAARYKVSTYSKIIAADSLAMKATLFAGHALIYTFTTDNLWLNGGPDYIWNAHGSPSGLHANAVVGWSDIKHAWLTVNQYGASWGDSGYRWIDYDFFCSGLDVTTATYFISEPGNLPPHINQPPIAKACCNQSVSTGASVTLDGTASSDPDGNIVSYQWSKTSGGQATLTNANSPVVSISNMVAGIYVFTLTVTDDSSAISAASATVTVTGTAESYTITSAVKTQAKGVRYDSISWSIVLNNPPQFATIQQSFVSTSTGFADVSQTPAPIQPYSPTGSYKVTIAKSNKNKPIYYRLRIIKSDGTNVTSSSKQAL